jgi:hypothetical protein
MRLILLVCFKLISILSLASFNRDKLFGGGSIGASFGTYTSVQVKPMAGYYLLPKTAAGISATYEYYKHNKLDFATSIYGGSIFARQYLTASLFAQLEYELLSLQTEYFDNIGKYRGQYRFLHHGILAGGGYSSALGERGSFFILLMANINHSDNSPYPLPIIRIGVMLR